MVRVKLAGLTAGGGVCKTLEFELIPQTFEAWQTKKYAPGIMGSASEKLAELLVMTGEQLVDGALVSTAQFVDDKFVDSEITKFKFVGAGAGG